jgi:hypothetical protein
LKDVPGIERNGADKKNENEVGREGKREVRTGRGGRRERITT